MTNESISPRILKTKYGNIKKTDAFKYLVENTSKKTQPLWGCAGVATRRPLAEARERRPAGRPVQDIAKAGCLLAAPPLPVHFQDEEDMRRVYALIYDVFRYKSVMDQALTDVSFFQLNPHLRGQRSQVWLLLFDLWQRDFKAREPAPLLAQAGLADAEAALWAAHVRLAAALARMRIKHRAPRLELLLPPHLRDHRVVAIDSAFVSAWLNPFRTRDKVPLQLLEEAGLRPLAVGEFHLTRDTFTADGACPRVILFHPDRRADLAQSRVVRDYQLILQDRTFCLGPSAMARTLRKLELRGSVAQTHINSARTTAYLAALLSDDDSVHKLLAFGAGDRKEEYEAYLRALGVQNVEVHAESFVEAAAQHTASARAAEEDTETAVSEDIVNLSGDSAALTASEEMWSASGDEGPLSSVVAVLATPPSTYSGVADPVELACSRGGDLSVLQLLTDSDAGSAARGRVAAILDEQRQTLLRAMSRPQIQVVLYETHSIVAAENSDMVSRLVREVNHAALERHAEERGRPLQPGVPPPDHLFQDLQVPPCDLFEVGTLPDMGPNGEDHHNFEEEGCYLAVLQRKEVVRLDNKYMIDIAESRGLFGIPAGAKKSAAGRRRREGADARRWWREAAQHVARGQPGPLRLTRTRRRATRPPLALPVTSLPMSPADSGPQ
ncbi:putative methyltransferase NSUN7 [Schistocerca americana]|uniref:putative methyltransferase NSUN7 n=1 Tax=Schistocerca americana TaxID=7009 RepID=UPI001F4FF978|nr:putative methyltransferase NSUN7 [Schistocerca americana]